MNNFDRIFLVLIPLLVVLCSWLAFYVYKLKHEAAQFLKELDHHEDRFKRLFDSNLIGILIAETHGTVLEANEAFLEMTGFDRGDLLSKKINLTEITPPEWEEQDTLALQELEAYGVASPREKELLRLQGTRVPVQIGGAILREFPDQCLYYVVDLIERKKSEEAIYALNTILAQKLVELEAANQLLDGFNHSVCHDLRNPLHLIDGFASLLEMKYLDKLDDKGRQALEGVRRNTARMKRLIDDLLAFARLGSEAVHYEEVDLGKMAMEIYAEIESTVAHRHIQFTVLPLPLAKGDAVLLREVIMNLLTNAVKYSGKKEEAVIEVGGKEQGGENIFYVKDNGAGFDMAQKVKLFRIFQRLHTREQFEGTGIGLALSKQIIEKHGGRMWAEAKLGEGATFGFSLPREALQHKHEEIQEKDIPINNMLTD